MSRRVVVDTNVLVSALLTLGGNAAEIIDMISIGLIEVIYNRRLLDEYKHVLTRTHFGFPENLVNDALDIFIIQGIDYDAPKSDIPMVHESDRVFYDTALACSAVLIAGNTKHFPNEPFIMNPAEFLKQQQQKKN